MNLKAPKVAFINFEGFDEVDIPEEIIVNAHIDNIKLSKDIAKPRR